MTNAVVISDQALATLIEWAEQNAIYLREQTAGHEHEAGVALERRRVLAQQACRLVWADANQETEEIDNPAVHAI